MAARCRTAWYDSKLDCVVKQYLTSCQRVDILTFCGSARPSSSTGIGFPTWCPPICVYVHLSWATPCSRVSDLDEDEDGHPPSNSATPIPSAPTSTFSIPNFQLPPSRPASSHHMLEGWSQLASACSPPDNVSRTKITVPPTPSGAIVSRNCSSPPMLPRN